MDEWRLIERVLDGDQRAARVFYDAHVDRVHRLAYRITGDPEEAREATQETFIRAFDQLGSFRGDAALATWLHSIAVSVSLNLRKRSLRSRERSAPLELAESLRDTTAPSDPDLRERLHQAIESLPNRMRVIFIMHELEGFTHAEIGEALGLADGSCKAYLFRARARLRAALFDYAEDRRA